MIEAVSPKTMDVGGFCASKYGNSSSALTLVVFVQIGMHVLGGMWRLVVLGQNTLKLSRLSVEISGSCANKPSIFCGLHFGGFCALLAQCSIKEGGSPFETQFKVVI